MTNSMRLSTSWDDLRVPVTATNIGTANDPNFSQVLTNGAGSQGVYTYLFDASAEEELFFNVQLPHAWKEGTDIEPHVHWFPTSADTGTVRWGLEYTWSSVNGAFGNTTIIYTNDPADGTAYKHQLADFSAISATGQTLSSMLMCRVFRDAGNVADTYTGDAGLLEIDFHHRIDSLGSLSEYVK